ncbi:phosphatidylcholine:ceramide cholinephosphotransferase 2 [Trypanosoma conorhini]|uniref:Phosphatidylcholine:ceramide cholinephosphotransferase 2 n=1 Tax=Trypanosoma conorhini TaxID=83891 RepID=A0A3R7MTS5_9TRYP|nr:phosphatidylcholine:ceramide cholinephosphotransferase 2 [Trypanosoma conorhini]RNF11092.1 phosphatidylcholine:ceramide cholinephosphotransferase 2 [Trypanosoma conorhini]
MERAWPSGPLPLKTQAIRFIPVLLFSIFILACALLVTNERMPDPKIVRPLPDILFELFPKVGWLENMTDVGIGLLNALSILVLFKLYLLHRQSERRNEIQLPFQIPFVSRFLFGVWEGKHDTGIEKRDVHLIAWIRFVTTYFTVLLFRSLVIVMTSYPATDNHCQNPVKIENPVKNVILTVVTLGSGAIHCGDLMFSGHTVNITLSVMLQWVYGPMLHMIFRPLSVVLVLLSFYFIIASRSHYTDDILVSFYVTAVTFVAMRHSPDGAPWQLQLLIGWWPCCGSSASTEAGDGNAVVVAVEVLSSYEVGPPTVSVGIQETKAVEPTRANAAM